MLPLFLVSTFIVLLGALYEMDFREQGSEDVTTEFPALKMFNENDKNHLLYLFVASRLNTLAP